MIYIGEICSSRGTKRNHGCSRRPDIFQIASYFSVLIFNLVVFGLVVPVIPSLPGKIVVGLVYGFINVLLAWKAMILTLRDNTEKNTVKTSFFSAHGYRVKLSGEFNHFCKVCDSVVADNVHHCKQCRRCVRNLDHHCKWINNCIDRESLK